MVGAITSESASDPRIDADFERTDSRSFAASVCLHGKRVDQVSIWHGCNTWRKALCLSYNTATSMRKLVNDWLPVEDTLRGLVFAAGK